MLKTTSLFSLFALLLALPASAAEDKKTTDDSVNKSSKDQMAKSEANMPAGFVIIEDFVAADLKQLPIELLYSAESEFANKNFGESAADLRSTGRVFRLEAKQASSDSKKELTTAADELEKFADNVKNQTIKGETAFRAQVSRALYHDAAHHRALAAKEWDKKQYHRAGDDLRASAAAAELATQWSDKDIAQSSKSSIDKARDVAMRLTRNEGWTSGEVVDALDKMDLALRGMSDKMMIDQNRSRATETPVEF
jgi:hypothetical protein